MRRAPSEMNLLGRRRCALSGHGFGTNLGGSGRLGTGSPSASLPIAKDPKRLTKVIQRSLTNAPVRSSSGREMGR